MPAPRAAAEWIAVSGLARLSVDDRLEQVEVGDEVEVWGLLSRPQPPDNPGQYDYRDHLRRQGTDCIVRARSSAAVQRSSEGESWSPRRWIARARRQSETILANSLSPRTAPVANALLLGTPGNVDDDVRTAFAQSGTMHLLAISGLHVGILAGFLWLGCRLFNLPLLASSAVLLIGVLGYAAITDGRPPIVRAAVFVLIAAAGRPWYRQAALENTLAIAALAVLAWNPTDLFDTGAQLSFLAVTGILWSQSLNLAGVGRTILSVAPAVGQDCPPHEPGLAGRWYRRLGSALGQGYLMMFGIWLFTVPLVAARFNLVSPIGFVINIGLIPLVTLVLWMGYGVLFCGFVLPFLTPVFAVGFDGGLNLLLVLVEMAARWQVGHLYVPTPPGWWIVGYYVLLAGVLCWRQGRGDTARAVAEDARQQSCAEAEGAVCVDSDPRDVSADGTRSVPATLGDGTRNVAAALGRWKCAAICLWIVMGLAIGLAPEKRDGLRCTFLAVGHGCAVLIELPNGKTALYDAGSLHDGNFAQQIVQSALWSRGVSQLDAVFVSHADIDHFNGTAGLLQTVPIGCLLVTQPFLRSDQSEVAQLCTEAVREGVPFRVLAAGDRVNVDEAVVLRILHPGEGVTGSNDNADSIVLLVEYAGRRILLTGDVEKEGLDQLLRTTARRVDFNPHEKIDIMLSPHHGSRGANTPELAAWANADRVVASAGRVLSLPALRNVYGPNTQVLSTGASGAVTFEIKPDGTIHVTTHRDGPYGSER